MSPSVQRDINLLHASVLSMVEFDEDIFAAGHCFDENQYPLKRGLFCPFAHRLPAPEVRQTFYYSISRSNDLYMFMFKIFKPHF